VRHERKSGINLERRLVNVIKVSGGAGSHCIIIDIAEDAGIIVVSVRVSRGGGHIRDRHYGVMEKRRMRVYLKG
jgi:hypothetical protein